ncbi:hypothetical protein QJS66_09735 [Kocuria rhizophila]|nr:hypothetical protein QJS66_09735 [Kocuria rhizophila]
MSAMVESSTPLIMRVKRDRRDAVPGGHRLGDDAYTRGVVAAGGCRPGHGHAPATGVSGGVCPWWRRHDQLRRAHDFKALSAHREHWTGGVGASRCRCTHWSASGWRWCSSSQAVASASPAAPWRRVEGRSRWRAVCPTTA